MQGSFAAEMIKRASNEERVRLISHLYECIPVPTLHIA